MRAQTPSDTVLGEWTFPKTGDIRGWTANNHIAGVAARGSALHGRAIGSDMNVQFFCQFFTGTHAGIEVQQLQQVDD